VYLFLKFFGTLPIGLSNPDQIDLRSAETKMKINGITTPGTTAPSRPAGRAAAARPADGAPAEVQLSSVSAQLGAEPVINEARVKEIRQAVLEGRFAINSSAIADRLLDSARELVAAQRRG
jgi:negative regulator of flagellin synthesis FlgM